MTLHAPQIVFVVLLTLSLGVSLAQHGQPRTGRHEFGTTLVAQTILIAILAWGGFFG